MTSTPLNGYDLPRDVTVVLVPGLRDSGPGHWQSVWEVQLPRVRRVVQQDWFTPRRQEWVDCLARLIDATPGRIVVAAHSLGCMTTAHLPPESAARIEADDVVAVEDCGAEDVFGSVGVINA